MIRVVTRQSSSWRRIRSGLRQSGSAQRGAELAGCHADLPPKDGRQVALICETSLLRDQGKGLIGPADQGFRPLDPALHYVALRPDARRLLEGTAEVIGAETSHPGEIRQGQPIIEMRLDVILH